MKAPRKNKKYAPRKNNPFLKLIKNYRVYSIDYDRKKRTLSKYQFSFSLFKYYYILVMPIFYIFELSKSWEYLHKLKYIRFYNILRYYSTFRYTSFHSELSNYKSNFIGKNVNFVIFSRPAKQLFLMFFKSKPIFIFTGGLMRIIMYEQRKSSKKLYKVAISLIKLACILLIKRNFFPQGYLKLINVGNLRSKILLSIYKLKQFSKITYVIIKFRTDFTSQKLETRRAVKKYVKRRFKIR